MAIQGLWKLENFDGDLRDFVFVMTNYELMLEALYMLKLLFKMQGCTVFTCALRECQHLKQG